MIVNVWLPLALPLLIVPLAALPALRALPDRLHPRTACWTLAATAVGLASASTLALGVLTAAAVLRLPPVAALGRLSVPLADRLPPALAVPTGTAAGALLAASALAAYRALGRQRCDLAAARARTDGHDARRGLVVLPDDAVDAYALPGPRGRRRGGRVVVTRGMLGALSPREREVLLAHERAHLAARHHLFLSAVELAAAVHPLLRPLRAAVGYAVERWADESAARHVADRGLTARAVGRAALAGAGAAPRGALGAAAGPVPRRVAALLGGEAARRTGTCSRGRALLAAAVLAGLLGLSAGTALDAAGDLHHQVEQAQRGT